MRSPPIRFEAYKTVAGRLAEVQSRPKGKTTINLMLTGFELLPLLHIANLRMYAVLAVKTMLRQMIKMQPSIMYTGNEWMSTLRLGSTARRAGAATSPAVFRPDLTYGEAVLAASCTTGATLSYACTQNGTVKSPHLQAWNTL